MTPFDDDELARALARVPVGAYAPLDRLQGRARQLQVRRRLAGTGIALAAALAVAVPSALALTGGDGGTVTPAPPATPTPAPTGLPTTPDCPGTYSERFDAAQPQSSAAAVSGPVDLPEELRLLWAPDAAPAPDQAFAMDRSGEVAEVEAFFEQCPPPPGQSDVVAQVDDAIVQRQAVVSEAGSWLRIDPATARTLDAGGVPVLVEVPATAGGPVRAEWEADGVPWTVVSADLTDAELIELVRDMRLEGDRIDLADWSVAAGTERVVNNPGVDDGPARLELTVRTDELELIVTDDDRDPLLSAAPGSREVQLPSGAAVLRELSGGALITWQPTPGTTALLSGRLSADELLAVAETVATVPTGDPRLDAVWTLGDVR